MSVVDAKSREGYSVSNVDAVVFDITKNKGSTETHDEHATTRARQSLLDLLKKAYKYRFQ
jgi:hypothetical protein